MADTNKAKLRQKSHGKVYYQSYRIRYASKLIRRKNDRLKRIRAAQEHPEIGSPSQLRMRRKRGLLPKGITLS